LVPQPLWVGRASSDAVSSKAELEHPPHPFPFIPIAAMPVLQT
jgi:hypothetical protein